MPAKKPNPSAKSRRGRSPAKTPSLRPLRVELAEAVRERDGYASELLRRMMPEFGPIDFTKAELFTHLGADPSLRDLIEQIANDAE